MKIKARWIWAAICFLTFVALILTFSFREAILVRAANFMAPKADGAADVIILEGEESPETGAVHIAVNLLFSKQASRMVVVLHQSPANKGRFVLDESYPDLVKKRLIASGLTEKQFMVMVTPVRHPITLTEATIVLEALSKEGVMSVWLLSNGFHTRRSFLVYRYVGRPHGINVIPLAYFNDYQPDNWWLHEDGVREFVSELFKLLYYQIRGYIPLRSDY
jgi:hypothetical protein